MWDHLIVSLDVKNLFTNIPKGDVLRIVRDMLYCSTLGDEVSEKVFQWLQAALDRDFFVFNNTEFK